MEDEPSLLKITDIHDDAYDDDAYDDAYDDASRTTSNAQGDRSRRSIVISVASSDVLAELIAF